MVRTATRTLPLLALLLCGASAQAAEVDVAAALVDAKKPKWDPKGKALDPYIQSKFKRKQDKWEEARELLVTVLDHQPGCGKALRDLSYTLVEMEEAELAVQVSDKLVAYFDDRDQAWMTAYEARDAAEQVDSAVEAAKKALELEPKSLASTRAIQDTLIDANRVSDAAAELDVSELKKADIACLRVRIASLTDALDEAETAAEACEESESGDLKRSAKGWLATAQGDTEQAMKMARDTGDENSSRYNLAVVRRKEGNLTAALNLLDALLRDEPEALDAHALKARCMFELDRGDDARAWLGEHVFADGWMDAHKAGEVMVVLKAKGEDWPKDQTREAAALQVTLLLLAEDKAGAEALLSSVVEIYGENDTVKAAQEEIAAAGG